MEGGGPRKAFHPPFLPKGVKQTTQIRRMYDARDNMLFDGVEDNILDVMIVNQDTFVAISCNGILYVYDYYENEWNGRRDYLLEKHVRLPKPEGGVYCATNVGTILFIAGNVEKFQFI